MTHPLFIEKRKNISLYKKMLQSIDAQSLDALCLLENYLNDGFPLTPLLVRGVFLWGEKSLVALMLPHMDKSLRKKAFVMAATGGHFSIIRKLNRNMDSQTSTEALCWAAHNGHLETVKYLLNKSKADPCADKSLPLQWAMRNQHFDVVDLLLPVSKEKKAIADIKKKSTNKDISFVTNYLKARKSKIELQKEIKNDPPAPRRLKI